MKCSLITWYLYMSSMYIMYSILPEHLCEVHIGGEKLFLVTGNGPQLLEWKEYGFKMDVPEGATSGPCEFTIKAIVAGQYKCVMPLEPCG